MGVECGGMGVDVGRGGRGVMGDREGCDVG